MKLEKYARLQARRVPLDQQATITESYKTLSAKENTRYLVGAMLPVKHRYTEITIEQANRVQNQLEKNLSETCIYQHQGSVSNNTHIMYYSDIDLLVITQKFVTHETNTGDFPYYVGSPNQDLLSLRRECKTILEREFTTAKVDAAGSKSISIEGGTLSRKVDVVPSNILLTNAFKKEGKEWQKGIQVWTLFPCFALQITLSSIITK